MPQELLEQDVDKFAVYARVTPGSIPRARAGSESVTRLSHKSCTATSGAWWKLNRVARNRVMIWLGEYVLSDPALADATANTMAFATLTFCQLFHAFDVRSEDQSIFKIGLFYHSSIFL